MGFPLDIRKQEEVLGESYMMIPDSKARCEASVGELFALLVGVNYRQYFGSVTHLMVD